VLNLPPSAFPSSLRALLVPPPAAADPDGVERRVLPRRRRWRLPIARTEHAEPDGSGPRVRGRGGVAEAPD